jgi:hypothetical protein
MHVVPRDKAGLQRTKAHDEECVVVATTTLDVVGDFF